MKAQSTGSANVRGRHSQARHEPTAVADDQPGKRMADLDIEVEAAILGEFTSLAARCEHERQRNAEDAPAAQHHLQPPAIDHERHRDGERPEALADEPLVAATALLQHARECATSEAAPPTLASI